MFRLVADVSRLGLLLVLSPLAFGFQPQPSSSSPAILTARDLARLIRETGLDANECYRVRDLNFTKDDIKLYFNDGYLIFSKPVLGQRLTAVFTAEGEGGDGEVIVIE